MVDARNVAVRVGTLWVLCFVLLTVTWFVSYYFLPVGVIRDVFPSAYLPLGNSFLSAFLIIFFFNLLVGCGFTVALNLLSAKSVPIGYFYPLVQICLFGIFLGTDSFTLSHGGRFFPSPNLVIGAGFYEFTTYILVVLATAKFTMWNQTGWLSGSLERVKMRRELKLARSEGFTLVLAVLLLVAAAVIEANGIIGK